MKTISGGMATHLDQVVTTICTCWKITRADDEVYGYTDHDADLTIGGVVFKAATGYYRSAISSSADSGVDNLDVQGFLDDNSLNETELRNGAYDYAQVEIFACNWNNLTDGIIRLRYGFFGEVMIVSSGFFRVELRGLTQLFAQTIGETYAPECRADLGDERCKILLVPASRHSLQDYKVDDRIIVPDDPGLSYEIPIVNPSFEANWTQIESDWNGTTFIISNYDPTVPNDAGTEYSLRPVSSAGSATFMRTAGQLAGAIPSLEGHIKAGTPLGHRLRLSVFWANDGGVSAGGSYESSTGWFVPTAGADDYNLGPIDPTPGFPNGTNARFKIEWDLGSATPGTSPTFSIGATPKADGEVIPQGLMSPKGPPLPAADGWTFDYNQGAYVSGPNIWLAPYEGDWHLVLGAGPQSTLTATQIFDLTTLDGIDFDILDAGGFDIKLNAQWAAETQGVKNFFSMMFYDDTNFLIQTSTEPEVLLGGKGFWEPHSYRVAVPANTRKVKFVLNTHNYTNNARSQGAFDVVTASIFEPSYEMQDNYLSYNSVEFVCTVAGTSAAMKPDYTYNVGDVIVDGTATFVASLPLHTFTSVVTAVTDHKVFVIDGTLIDKPNDWFEWGVLEMLSGENIKKKMEIKAWDNDLKQITLALPLPYVPQIGDKMRFHTGCAKSRATCNDKFENIVNYRGEPDLPGTDQYFKIGAANSGGSLPAPSGGKGGGK